MRLPDGTVRDNHGKGYERHDRDNHDSDHPLRHGRRRLLP